ncbi:MAG: MFS transporter [Magnetococcales bacterium]|nr:MFS transporter [Magnetococcales bacterium]
MFNLISAVRRHRNMLVLAATQGLLTLNNITLIAMTGLVGLDLAENKALATLPIATFVAGGALAALPAALFMQKRGRRTGFRLGALLGLCGNLIAMLGVFQREFFLVCLGSLLCGIYNGFGQQYRFAAADAAPEAMKSRAISLTLAGGILGGVLGPELGKWTRSLMEPMFVASYGLLGLISLLAWLLLGGLEIPGSAAQREQTPGRPLWRIVTQPVYLVAVLAATTGYGVMNLLMSATPLVMLSCNHSFGDSAFVLEWHVLGMFVPSFFTGSLIHRFGVGRILLLGIVLMLGCSAVALSGKSLSHFWWALLLLGVGWNFLYIGGTTLLTTTCRPEEKAHAQGFNDFFIFAVQTVTALSSGMIVNDSGWDGLNRGALPACLVALLAIAWLQWREHGKVR